MTPRQQLLAAVSSAIAAEAMLDRGAIAWDGIDRKIFSDKVIGTKVKRVR